MTMNRTRSSCKILLVKVCSCQTKLVILNHGDSVANIFEVWMHRVATRTGGGNNRAVSSD